MRRSWKGLTAAPSWGITIKQDAEGRYCLNDLHKAAGGGDWSANDKNQPKDWLITKHTAEMIVELSNSGKPPIFKKAGRYGGTYVCKELVYAYAMWISPKFHLAVIRAYDELMTSPVQT